MKNQEEINIYWSPGNFILNEESWNMLYLEPQSLLKEFSEHRNPNSGTKSFLSCPAFREKLKNVFSFRTTFDSKYYYEGNVTKNIGDNVVDFYSQREPSLVYGPTLIYNLSWIFFAEEPVECFFTSPYFHKVEYMKSGVMVPGKFDIGSWFRPFNIEIQMHSSYGEIFFKKEDPLFYMDINTNKKVNFIRFNMNERLYNISQESIQSPVRYKKFMQLKERYDVFNKTKVRDIILNEIKKEII